MELLDRALQRQLLTELAETYPEPLPSESLGFQQDDRRWNVNTMYLAEHALIEVSTARPMSEGMSVIEARITARGLDFLQDDGGLTAILGVVTVRLDAETIRALIEDKIDETDMPPEEKSRLTKWLSTAGTEALKEATKRLVGAALDHAPDALRLLQTLPG
jgi:hypothetical protein